MGSKKKNTLQRTAAKSHQHSPVSGAGWSWRAFAVISLAIAALTFVVYMQVLSHGFVQFDDTNYVTQNPVVQEGLTSHSVGWAFTSFQSANWHPLTWLSLMMDYRLSGLNPLCFHLTNLLLHIANSLLLLLVLALMTRSLWKSAFVAALFALHPLHVESVAWVAERKDVLSTFFMMLTLLSYWYYARRPGFGRYTLVLTSFAAGLMAKPMLVSLPLVLIMMDSWPLGRLSRKSLLEKVPLLVLSAASCAVTMVAQRLGGAVVELQALPLQTRLGNALYACSAYLLKTVWPAGLSFFYVQSHHVSVAIPVAVLLLISAGVLLQQKRRPYLGVGWLWYLVTLIPVAGIVQVGGQLMADRYTYVPLIGVFIMIVWLVSDLIAVGTPGDRRLPYPHTAVLVAVSLVIIAALSACTWRQCSYWKDDQSVCEHAISVDPANYVAHDTLGTSLANQGRLEDAVVEYEAALKAHPDFAQAGNNIGITLERLGRYDDAAAYLGKAVESFPNYAEAHSNLGNVYHYLGRHRDEMAEYTKALDINPGLDRSQVNMGDVLTEFGRYDEAGRHYAAAVDLAPNNVRARVHYAATLLYAGRYAEAWQQVHALRQYNVAVPPKLLQALSTKMPEPVE